MPYPIMIHGLADPGEHRPMNTRSNIRTLDSLSSDGVGP